MRVGDYKLDRVYFFMEEGNTFSLECKNAHDVRKKLHDLKVANRKSSGKYFGDIKVLDNTITYKEFDLIPTKADIDNEYVEAKNMTDLKKRVAHIIKGKKNAKLCTVHNGFVNVITKKNPPKRLLLVEEIDPGDKEVFLEDKSMSDLINENKILSKYNSLPDAKYIYYRKEMVRDYDTYKTYYTYKVYRVLERTSYLEDMDKLLSDVYDEYTAASKYHIDPTSKISLVKLPDLKKYPVMYNGDAMYLKPEHIITAFSKRCNDVELIKRLLQDSYTNLQPSVFDEETMDNINEQENTTRRNTILKWKKIVKGSLIEYENASKKENRTNDEEKQLIVLKLNLESDIRSLVMQLVYRDINKKTVNYSLVRHMGSIIRQRDLELEEMKEEYYENLLTDLDYQIKQGYLEETKFHKIRF